MAIERRKHRAAGTRDYITWTNDGERQEAFDKYSKNDMVDAGVSRASNSSLYSFKDIDTNVSARPGFGRDNYEHFRIGEAIPKKPKQIIEMCMSAHNKVGIVHNVIDLMADFACQGIDIVHPVAKTEKYLKKWFKKVCGKDRSERFLNQFYRAGIVLCRRHTAQLTTKQSETLEYTQADGDHEVVNPTKPKKNEIPISYRFINPLAVDIVDDELAKMGHYLYGYKIPTKIKKIVEDPDTPIKKKILSYLSPEIIAACKDKQDMVVIDPDKLIKYYYKKDDWMLWPLPMVYCILDDLILLEKMKLADLAALDGAISNVRLWTMGSLTEHILPSDAQISALADILTNNVGGGCFDLIWGPDLQMTESKTTVHQFLGSAKYQPVLSSINAGLGIPPTLTGSATESGFTNNYISLKTLIERLEYGRAALLDFWEKELQLVMAAKGFQGRARVRFDRMTLSDEASEKSLLIDLVDRKLMSVETLIERFGEMPELEAYRLEREKKLRERDKMPNALGPYADIEEEYKKLYINQGLLTPSEIGLELEERKPGEETKVELDHKAGEKLAKMKGVPGQGRPINSKDKIKRKPKVVKPRSKASITEQDSNFLNCISWANSMQNNISEVITPTYLLAHKKKYVKELTSKQVAELENIKFGVLFKVEAFTNPKDINFKDLLSSKIVIPARANQICKVLMANMVEKTGKELTINHHRDIQSYVYSIMKGL